MGIRVALHHKTRYRYDRDVNLGPQVIRLRPAPHCRTHVASYSLKIEPAKHFINWQQDPQGNYLARVVFLEKVREFSLEIDLHADMVVINPFDFFLEPEANEFPFTYSEWLKEELQSFRQAHAVGPKLAEFIAGVPRTSKRTIDFIVDINQYVQKAVRYVTRAEPGVQTCEETLTLGSGSCRDSAWLLVQLSRNLGLAARFVSGYLIQLKPDEKPLDGPAGAPEDFTDLHAWTEVYLPGAGWIGLDPTSGLLTGEGHIPLAATPEPASAAPVTGTVDPCEMEFEFEMKVTRIIEDPRVTKPYTDEQWARIESLGHQVDDDLKAGDVRLTMGGEPTFVSIDDMEGEEWNTAALGVQKRILAGTLFRKLAKRFAPGPLLHFGQGKWYPGESLPRWALGCYWRKDREPIWHDPELIAEDETPYGFGEDQARTFITSLAERLRVNPAHVIPGYEDAWYYMWKERRLPVNVDPLKSNLSNAEDRARLAKVFEQGLNKTVGYVLPIKPLNDGGEIRWESGPWFLRTEQMFLIPGDSAMGFRLPLDSIPWVSAKDYPHIYSQDPFADRPPLPTFSRNGSYPSNGAPHGGSWFDSFAHNTVSTLSPREPVFQMVGGGSDASGLKRERARQGTAAALDVDPISARSLQTTPLPRHQESAAWIVRTALCVEARQGVLHIFMPPVGEIEEYLALTHAIELTAEEVGLPVRIEGYTPPYDPRMTHLKVTPDPGVIEVNLQPSSEWSELVENVTGLYEDARQSRLGTEKFMLDGRHTGTGGGNHLVIGGATPADSPFLRRPDLLKSLITFWNNRPSLSYVFSGLFIGPTSQAPRADEARHESVYELETALGLIANSNGTQPPWMVDRVLRNLLVDLTGNTHRAEFCIDKLYAPESSTGRLGLVEFRAFEMPPHARMSLTQQLLLRALIARFWKTPCEQPLVRWETSLHDRFMLPHFIAQDFNEVISELAEAGYPLEHDWFAPHFEFRFPLCGQVTQQGVHLELRQAIEPWHVLGEEPGPGGTARYVDSSIERLQVKVQGMTDSRYVIAVNGRRVPLHPTGTRGEFVAGVRFRAWQPPSCLHPTIGVHSPLVFDVIDTWNKRSIGGCTWHVSHPGGRSFDTFPVNANEAESRRGARFFSTGHSAGRLPIPPEEQNPDFPFTLDMRRPVTLATLD